MLSAKLPSVLMSLLFNYANNFARECVAENWLKRNNLTRNRVSPQNLLIFPPRLFSRFRLRRRVVYSIIFGKFCLLTCFSHHFCDRCVGDAFSRLLFFCMR